MDDYVDAIIRVRVPKWQIGEEVSVHFPDTMMKRGKCEILDELERYVDEKCIECDNFSIHRRYLKTGIVEGTCKASGFSVTSFERPQGEWIKIFDSEYPNVWHYECSKCHERPLCSQFTKEDFLSEFCPHCGARMVEK